MSAVRTLLPPFTILSQTLRQSTKATLIRSNKVNGKLAQPVHQFIKMASSTSTADSGKVNFPTDASLPGEHFEVRQTHPTGDYTPDPSKSLPLSPARQALLDDIIALYEMKPTVERVRRYTPDCVYNDQFVYVNDRYKMAGQWFALPKLFKDAKSHGYQVVTNDRDLIQFRHEEVS
jgi:hypothetical protein